MDSLTTEIIREKVCGVVEGEAKADGEEGVLDRLEMLGCER